MASLPPKRKGSSRFRHSHTDRGSNSILSRNIQERSVSNYCEKHYSMKQKSNVSLRRPGKITKVRKGGLQMIQPSPKQSCRSAFPPTREQIYNSSKAGKCSVSSILKGTVLSRRLLRLVPTPVKARALLQISFFSFETKGGWSKATCNSSLGGSRTEQVQITVLECSCSEHAKENQDRYPANIFHFGERSGHTLTHMSSVMVIAGAAVTGEAIHAQVYRIWSQDSNCPYH